MKRLVAVLDAVAGEACGVPEAFDFDAFIAAKKPPSIGDRSG